MAYPQDITPDAAGRYIEAHGVEVRTVGVSCLTVFAVYTRNSVAFSRIECLPYQAAAIRAWLGY